MIGAVKGNDEACIVQSNFTKVKNLLYFQKRLRFLNFFVETGLDPPRISQGLDPALQNLGVCP